MKVFGNEGLPNGIPVTAAGPDKVEVLILPKLELLQEAEIRLVVTASATGEPTTHTRTHQSMTICRQRNVQAHHLLLCYCCYLQNTCIQA